MSQIICSRSVSSGIDQSSNYMNSILVLPNHRQSCKITLYFIIQRIYIFHRILRAKIKWIGEQSIDDNYYICNYSSSCIWFSVIHLSSAIFCKSFRGVAIVGVHPDAVIVSWMIVTMLIKNQNWGWLVVNVVIADAEGHYERWW